MSLHHSPRIVTNGLISYHDIENIKSYPDSGTTWFDLTGNGNDVTSINTPTFNDNEVEINVGDRLDMSSPVGQSTTELTVCAWVRVPTAGDHGSFNRYLAHQWVTNGWLLASNATDWFWGVGQSSVQYNDLVLHNDSTDWTYLAGRYDGANVELFVNAEGSGSPTALVSGVLGTGSIIFFGDSAANQGNTEIAVVQIYSVGLTNEEIKQNYEAQRKRFGQ